MRYRIAGAFSYANVMATVAVFVALSGGAYAALGLGRNSVKSQNLARNSVVSSKIKHGAVTTSKLANGAVTGAKVKAGSLLASNFKAGQLRQGGAGPQGLTGPKGATGSPGPVTGAAGGDLSGSYPNPTVRVTLPPAATLSFGSGWSGATTDGEPAASCYEDREGIVHFAGAIHSATAGAMPVMATLPSSCPPPPAAIIVQVPANLNNSIQPSPYMLPITIGAVGTLTNPAGIAGNATNPNDNLSMASVTYRAR